MMPDEAVTDSEQAVRDLETEDVSDEYEPDAYDDGYELDGDERAISDLEN